jgi:subtilisin family serine protease
VALVEPAGSYWTAVQILPQTGQVMQLDLLPNTGPIGWWQKLLNVTGFDIEAGRGIKVGVIDTGVGPHPYLDHCVPIGAFLHGSFYPGADQGRDSRNHGTHVSGIIGARPPAAGGAFGGIAPGADMFMARIFAANYDGNQGDVANAIDALSGQQGVDIINLSLSGAPSAIERDAIVMALRKGTVCICAAGNGFGGAVQYPAAYPESIAVSGLGLVDTAPAGTMPTSFIPTQKDYFGTDGIYLASFSNIGSEIMCSAPGNGIISTIPATTQLPAPYAEKSGTSMSAPLTAGALACILSGDVDYIKLPRSADRATLAKHLLSRYLMPISLDPRYQGQGMSRRP